MKTEKMRGGVQEIFKISIVTPSSQLYTKIEQFLPATQKRKLAHLDLIDGSAADAAYRIRKSIQAGRDAVILWDPMASAVAATYPQQRVFVVQPSVLDLLNSIRQVPKGMSCGVIIPFSLRAYYDDLEVQFKAMGVTFYCLASDSDERAMQTAVHQAALSGIQYVVGSAGIETYARGEGLGWIPLQPGWGGLVRAFSKPCGACVNPGWPREGRFHRGPG